MWILVGDLHLTDHARDNYRFGVFDWLLKQQQKRNPAATYIAGDITDQKDRHSATLVNKVVDGLTRLKPPVYVVMGNHDYRDHSNPFFNFLNHIQGLKFITDPVVIKAGRSMALIPHYRTQEEFDDAVRNCGGAKPDCFLVHQTFEGAIAESGVRLSGLRASPIESLKPRLGVYAGDVHRPQAQGAVTYVGCPYQVRFGDNFEPRSIWLDEKGKQRDLEFAAPHKWSLVVRGPESLERNKELCEGDQVKLTIELAREEAVDWKKIKDDILASCRELKLDVYGVKLEIKTAKRQRMRLHDAVVTPDSVFDSFCSAENVPSNIKQAGRGILDGN